MQEHWQWLWLKFITIQHSKTATTHEQRLKNYAKMLDHINYLDLARETLECKD
jgi:hypothetical protein